MKRETLMKEIVLQFTYHSDLIKVPTDVEENIRAIRKKFDKWLYDKSNEHSYWVYLNGQKKAVSYDTEAFVKYINEHHISDQNKKAYVVETNCKTCCRDIVTLYF